MAAGLGKATTILYWALGIVIGFSVLMALLPSIVTSVTGSGFNWGNITLATNGSGTVTNSTAAFSFVPFVAMLLVIVGAIVLIVRLADHAKHE